MQNKETVSKSKKGRPEIFPEEWLKDLKQTWPELTSRRALIDRAYAVEAYGIIKKHDKELLKFFMVSPYKTRSSLLTELGRFITLCFHNYNANDEEVEQIIKLVEKLITDLARSIKGLYEKGTSIKELREYLRIVRREYINDVKGVET
jgi:hypothetical protein